MRKACGVLALALLGGLLLADDKPPKCARCDGTKQVKCFACGGKGNMDLPCPSCKDGWFPCFGCKGTQTLMCPACGGSLQVGIEKLPCHCCDHTGKVPCLLCNQGRIKCPQCKGTCKVTVPCATCRATGRLRCPDCNGYATADKCPACEGTKQEKCPVCAGAGTVPSYCDNCKGYGKQSCHECMGSGRRMCRKCCGAGMLHMTNVIGDINKCPDCKGSGWLPCNGCGGKGTIVCTLCKGSNATRAPCWLCAGKKAIPCRRCRPTRAWTAREERTGVTVTVIACQDLEPQVPLGIRAGSHLKDFGAFRLILDARKATGSLQIGGITTLVGVSAADKEVCILDTARELLQDNLDLFARLLPTLGAPADGITLPVSVEPKGIAMRIVLAEKLGADAKAFRLKTAGLPTVELAAKPLAVDDWVRILLAAAPSKK